MNTNVRPHVIFSDNEADLTALLAGAERNEYFVRLKSEKTGETLKGYALLVEDLNDVRNVIQECEGRLYASIAFYHEKGRPWSRHYILHPSSGRAEACLSHENGGECIPF